MPRLVNYFFNGFSTNPNVRKDTTFKSQEKFGDAFIFSTKLGFCDTDINLVFIHDYLIKNGVLGAGTTKEAV